MAALKRATAWSSDVSTLDTFSEVVAQWVELQLESGEVSAVREAKTTVDELVFKVRTLARYIHLDSRPQWHACCCVGE